MQLSIITPEKILFSAEAAMVGIPGIEGDFGVLPGHAAFISSLRPGVITIETSEGKKHVLAVAGGIAEIVPERCTILAGTAVECDDRNALEIQAKLDEARITVEESEKDPARSEADKKQTLNNAIK